MKDKELEELVKEMVKEIEMYDKKTYPLKSYGLKDEMGLDKYAGESGYKENNSVSHKVWQLNEAQIKGMGKLLNRTLIRYEVLDKAYNIAREVGIYDNLIDTQNNLWHTTSSKAGYKNYNARDAVWDLVVAETLKNDLSKDEYLVLVMPYSYVQLASSKEIQEEEK
jgi:hypothetical protein